jgi:hypothetical protein
MVVTMLGEEHNGFRGMLDAQVRHRIHKALVQLQHPHQA